jgi:head-tail adaptor
LYAQVVATPADGVALAQEVQRAGKAGEVLKMWIDCSQKYAAAEKAGKVAAKSS